MQGFAVEVALANRDVLVVGPAPELATKLRRLLDAGAKVTLVAEAPLEPEVIAFEDRVALEHRRATDADLDGKALVFVPPWSTDDDEARARRWHAAAVRAGTLFCALDRPETCTFTNVGVVRAGGLTLAVSSGGASPGLVRRIREDLERVFVEPRFERFVAELAALRATLPRGERAAKMAEAVAGFAIRATLEFPGWFASRSEASSEPSGP